MAPDTAHLVTTILNAAWMVRHYARNRVRRRQAIQFLGAAVRESFDSSDDFEPLLTAILDGLRPKDDPPF
jgi:hypothetical protein